MKHTFRLASLLLLLMVSVIGCGSLESSQLETKPLEEKQQLVVKEEEKSEVETLTTAEETIEQLDQANGNMDPTNLTQDEKKATTSYSASSTKITTDSTNAVVKKSTQQGQTTTQLKTESKPTLTSKPVETKKKSASSETKPAETKVPAQTETKPLSTVTISIIGSKEIGTILSSTKIDFTEGDTVLDILLRASKKKKISVEYSGSGALAYIEGIDNLYEFDYGPKSGWNFKLNGATISKSSGIVKVNKDDVIEWIYREDYSEADE
jgi:hypothetical protein